MQPGADLVGCVGASLALVAGYQHATGDHPGDTGKPNPLPNATHN